MALSNIIGDLGYLGFAFSSQGWVSVPKLGGALFTISAHMVLLAYGDSQAQRVAGESGVFSSIILTLRRLAQRALAHMPPKWEILMREKPIGVPFSMLAFNGLGLFIDALVTPHAASSAPQIFLGLCIMLGCGLFALADFVGEQKKANLLLKAAPTILIGATVGNIVLALTTQNVFVMLSVLVFVLSNLAGFYTKIDKKEPISAGI